MKDIWFNTEQVNIIKDDETSKIVILHQCGDNKAQLLEQLEYFISTLISNDEQ